MERVIQLFILLPLLAFFISLSINKAREFTLSAIAFGSVGLNLLLISVFLLYWLAMGSPLLNLPEIALYQYRENKFLLCFFMDLTSAVYLWIGSFLTFLVTLYSRYYLHRERGYKRYFNTVLFFYFGYNLTILSGNFETLFMGWEVLGISSFLLIGFYRERYLPVKNAIKVFSIYRIGDLGIVLVMWLSHHLWHQNITFSTIYESNYLPHQLASASFLGTAIALMILVSAAAKSAMFPFTTWLPRAMEGPTPSSAIFYGSLSVHMGVFLLLRTYPFWEFQPLAKWAIGIIGLLTGLVSGMIARVQYSVKSQIAYASSAQLGLIFIELALGFHKLALLHFAGNAFLRTYQLLVSPSVVSYLIKQQLFIPKSIDDTIEKRLPKKLRNTLYVLSLNEWYLDDLLYRFLWNPLKWVGQKAQRIPFYGLFFGVLFLLLGGIVMYGQQQLINHHVKQFLPEFIGVLALLVVLRAFTNRDNIYEAWGLILMNNFLIAMAISFNEKFIAQHVLLYLSGPVASAIFGLLILGYLEWKEKEINLKQFYGHAYHYPLQAFLFFLCCLGYSGFPITPTFIGEDLIYSHIGSNQTALAFIVSLSFIVDGLAIIRIYSRLFLSMPVKRFHEVGYKSS